jgi:hypothetical protein
MAPPVYDAKRGWVGQVSAKGGPLGIVFQSAAKTRPRAGSGPTPEQLRQIDRRVSTALANVDEHVARARAALAELYIAHWSSPSSKSTRAAVAKRLRLVQIFFAAHVEPDHHELIFDDGGLFGGYVPRMRYASRRAQLVSVDSPLDARGNPTLPWLGIDKTRIAFDTPRPAQRQPRTKTAAQKPKPALPVVWKARPRRDALERWTGAIRVGARTVAVHAHSDAKLDARLGALLGSLDDRSNEALPALVALYDGAWSTGPRDVMTEARMRRRLRLCAIEVDDGDRSSLIFADGGLFGGHQVEIRVCKGRVTGHDLAG